MGHPLGIKERALLYPLCARDLDWGNSVRQAARDRDDGWVVGDQPAVLIEFDFEGDTANRFGMPAVHRTNETT